MYYLRTRPAVDAIQFTVDKTKLQEVCIEGCVCVCVCVGKVCVCAWSVSASLNYSYRYVFLPRIVSGRGQSGIGVLAAEPRGLCHVQLIVM